MLGPDEVINVFKNDVSNVDIKTLKMFGIIPRSIFHIFTEINQAIEQENATFKIKISYLEIY